jgi:hypothetical protein
MPDNTVALGVKTPEFNPLGLVGQFAQTQNALNQNKLFGQEFKARQAIGPLYQQAIDPKTGRLDSNKLLSAAAGNPDVAFKAGELASEAQAREAQQLGIDTATLGLQHKQSQLVTESIFPLARKAASGQPVTDQDILDTTKGLLQNPLFRTPEMVQGLITAAAELQSTPEAQRSQAIIDKYLQFHANTEGLTAALGQATQADTGGKVQLLRQGGIAGPQLTGSLDKTIAPQLTTVDTGPAINQAIVGPNGTQPVATYAKGLPPEVASQPVQTFDANGQAVFTPRSAITGGGAGAPGGGSAPGGRFMAGPAPGKLAAANVLAEESAKQGIALQTTADQVPARRAALMTMRDKVGQFASGPAANTLLTLGALATQFGLPAPRKGAAAQEEFNKMSTQIVLQQVAQLGGAGTDDKLAAGIKGNPSATMTRMGNKGVLALMLGNEDAITAKNEAWQKWLGSGKGPESYGSFSTQFNRLYDPRVFQAQYMSGPEYQTMLKGMSQAEKNHFAQAVKTAQKAGWIQ